MELDRLDLDEVIAVADIIKLLGYSTDVMTLGKCIRICEGAADAYRRVLTELQRGDANA